MWTLAGVDIKFLLQGCVKCKLCNTSLCSVSTPVALQFVIGGSHSM